MLEYVQRHIEKEWLCYRITERVITRFKVFIWEWTFRETLRVYVPSQAPQNKFIQTIW